MAQSQPRSQPIDPLNLSLRDTDSALPAPSWQAEDLIDDAAVPGQHHTGTVALGGDLIPRRERSLWGDAWRRLVRNKLAVIGLVIVATFALVAVLAPVIAPYGQAEVVD